MKFIKFLNKSAWWITLVLLILTPLHAIISTPLLYKLNLIETNLIELIIKAWKEGFVLILALLAFFKLIFAKKKLDPIHWLVIALAVISILVSLLNGISLAQFAWGLRSEFTIWIFLSALIFFVEDWNKKEIKTLLKAVLIVTGIVVYLGAMLQVLGYDFLINLGYRDDWSTYILHESPAFCQKEGGTDFCRHQSTFSGPNRYGSYLIVLLPFLWYYIKNKSLKYFLVTLALLGLALSLSLASWLGFIVSVILALALTHRKFVKKHLKKISLAALGLLLIAIAATILFRDSIMLKTSDIQHIQYPLEALRLIIEQPWGYGLGFLGPASFKVDELLLAENWYLQNAANMGLQGLLIFLALFYIIIKRLLKNNTLFAKIALLSLAAFLTQQFFVDNLVELATHLLLMFFVALGLSSQTPTTR